MLSDDNNTGTIDHNLSPSICYKKQNTYIISVNYTHKININNNLMVVFHEIYLQEPDGLELGSVLGSTSVSVPVSKFTSGSI